MFNNGFLVSVLSSNSWVLLCFPAFPAGKRWYFRQSFYWYFVDILISIYRVLLWVWWETTNCSKLGYSLSVLDKLCGFLGRGMGKGHQTNLSLLVGGFLLRVCQFIDLVYQMMLIDYCNSLLNMCFSFIVAF